MNHNKLLPTLRVIISAGGTGGHIFPAIAVADELKKQYPNIEILFVGAKDKMEMIKVPQAGYDIKGLDIAGWNRFHFWKNIFLPLKLIIAFFQSLSIIKTFHPHVVIGFGGYASFTTLKMAQLMGIPTLIHEQNSIAGKSNILLAKKAHKIFVAYDNMERYFLKSKIILVGNPLRDKIYHYKHISLTDAYQYFNIEPHQYKKIIIAIGGSLGSKAINDALYDNMSFFKQHHYLLLWQCGKNYQYYHDVKNRGDQHIQIMEFVDNMEYLYKVADVVISRAGALSVSELCIIGKPVIFAPFPYASEDHQTKNAQALVVKDAALMIKDNDLKSTLMLTLKALLNDGRLMANLSKNIQQFAVYDSSQKIANEILFACNKTPVNVNSIRRVFILGIGGAGISALAQYCLEQGIVVMGYDKTKTPVTIALEKKGINITYTDSLEIVKSNIDLVIYTPSVPIQLRLFKYFIQSRIPIIKRSQFLGQITQNGFNICIAGTHGKTTISTLMAHSLKHHHDGCNAYLGGISLNYNTNFWQSINSQLNVIEADEYDKSFLQLSPNIIVVTALDSDHLDIYGTHQNMVNNYFKFFNKLKPQGVLIVNDTLIKQYDFSPYNFLTYSTINDDATFFANNIRITNDEIQFDVYFKKTLLDTFVLTHTSLYNVENTLPVIASNYLLEVPVKNIVEVIKNFKGVRRRFQYIFSDVNKIYIDDYAHHPKELETLLRSVKTMFPLKKITLIFQPHLFSRTKDYVNEFATILNQVSDLVLLPIYPARENPIKGITSEWLMNKIKLKNKQVISKNLVSTYVKNNIKNIEILLTVGAGDIDMLVDDLKTILENDK